MAKKLGRKLLHPEGRTQTVAAAVPVKLVKQLDKWAKTNEITQSQAIVEAVRRLVE